MEQNESIREYNETLVLRIKQLCVEHNTSIPKIEKELGYGNGSIPSWRTAKKRAPHDRVEAVANRFGVSMDWLTRPREEKKPAPEGEQDAELNEIMELAKAADPQTRAFVLAGLRAAAAQAASAQDAPKE